MKLDIVDLVKDRCISGADLAQVLYNWMSNDDLEEFVDFLVDELELDDEDDCGSGG